MYQQVLQQPNNENGFTSQTSGTDVVQIAHQSCGPSQSLNIYKKNLAKVLGITQIMTGITCIISTILMVVNDLVREGHGIWGGILFLVAGILEVLSASKEPNIRMIVGNLVMSSISAIISAFVLLVGTIAASDCILAVDMSYEKKREYLAYAVILIISAVIEAVVSIISSTLYCGTCNKSSSKSVPTRIAENQPLADFQTNNYDQPSDPQMLLSPKSENAKDPPPSDVAYDEINL